MRTDEPLDPTVFVQASAIKLYRIARDKYADLSGIGASVSPGRWNAAGQEVIYTSLNSSTAQLEKLGHTPKDLIPTNLVRMTIEMSGLWTRFNDVSSGTPVDQHWYLDEAMGTWLVAYLTLAVAEDQERGIIALLDRQPPSGAILAVAVPSVHDDQWNVLLLPECLKFNQHVKLTATKRFAFDDRLFPSTA